MRGRLGLHALLAVSCLAPLQAQEPLAPQEEGQLLRDASALEWRGDHDEAIRTLERLLARKPASSGGLFALERVLRTVGRVGAVLPHADRYLAEDPGASGPRYLKLRVLVEIDSLAGLPEAAEAWFRAEPGSPDPYREVARLYRRAYGEAQALEILRQGREALGDTPALALDAGDLLAQLGRDDEAVQEWALALGDSQVDLEALVTRVRRLDAAGQVRLDPLVDALLAASTTEWSLTAVRVALAGSGSGQAVAVAGRGLAGVPESERARYLDEVADVGRTGQAPALEAWALGQRVARGPAAPPGLEARLAAAALAAGDTATALAAQTRLARALPRGSAERRRVVADLIRVEAALGDAATLETRLQGFQAEFPDAPEADELAAAVAAALASRGDAAAALDVAGQVTGPQSQLARAWLLFAEGKIAEGREALEAALPGLAPSRATEVIQLMAAMDRVGPVAAKALAVATGTLYQGHPGQARNGLDSALAVVPPEDRPALLHRAAGLALVHGDTAVATGHLRRLVEEHDTSPEAPEAMLWLARVRAADPAGRAEARELLRRLILERPQAAVVPAARRELERLGRSG